MLSIKGFTDSELLEQILNTQSDLENAEYDSGDYSAALSELIVAKIELSKRQPNGGNLL